MHAFKPALGSLWLLLLGLYGFLMLLKLQETHAFKPALGSLWLLLLGLADSITVRHRGQKVKSVNCTRSESPPALKTNHVRTSDRMRARACTYTH